MQHFLFFQPCISPHLMPFLVELAQLEGVGRVVVVAPRIDFVERRAMGWDARALCDHTGGAECVIAPTLEQVEALFETLKGEQTTCVFSGITAFPELTPWLRASLRYAVQRVLLTEPPLLFNHPLWLHRVRFLLRDFRYVRHFDHVFVMGDEFVPYYETWSRRWRVHPFLYCTEWRERTQPVPTDERLRVLYVGNFTRRKNVAPTLQQLQGLEGAHFGLVGDGEEREAIHEAAQALHADVQFYGARPMEEIPALMQQYDLLLLPSLHDGWGAVVNEALTLGLYVVCSDRCGAKYLLRDARHGAVYPLHDATQLRYLLQMAARHLPDLRKGVGERIQWAKENISGRAVAERFLRDCCN